MANKTFFTYDEQIEKLEKEKQLVISDPEFAKITLQKLGYFSLIGGYKDLFNINHPVIIYMVLLLKKLPLSITLTKN